MEKDAEAAIVLFWKAINVGDRVDSALKDMAVVMKQLDRTEEAIEAIKSFRNLCSKHAQESLDNVLMDLYKVHPITPTPIYACMHACMHENIEIMLFVISKSILKNTFQK